MDDNNKTSIKKLNLVDELFNEANKCFTQQLKLKLMHEVTQLMDRKRAARRVLANIEREEAELRLKVKHELED